VYFDVRSFPAYGRLSGNTLDALREGAGERVDAANQAAKRNPADFLLWKPDARHLMRWPSPWGEGYPGWHIECSAMARKLLGDEIDIHSGGEDNIFPHHECEIAQSCCAFNTAPAGAPFARCWFHARHLMVEGQKMSKSKGNFYTPRQLFEMGHQPGALRLELIRAHYRSNANFTMQGLEDCARMVARWRRVLDAKPGPSSDAARLRGEAATQEFTHAMHADLNVSAAIAAVNTWCAGVGETPAPEDQATLRAFDGVLGVLELPQIEARATALALYAPGTQPSDEVEALLQERRAARAAKDFGASDRLRDKLAAMGYAIKDVAGGRVEVRRV
jgi:cysteinyl-tRNA synthetase